MPAPIYNAPSILNIPIDVMDLKYDRDLRAAKADSLRHAMQLAERKIAQDEANMAMAQQYAASQGLDPMSANMAVNNPALYKLFNPQTTRGSLTAGQQMNLADDSLSRVMQAIEDMGASEDYPGGGALYSPNKPFELTSPSTWFDSQQPLYDVGGTEANPIYDVNPEVLNWVFGGQGQKRLQDVTNLSSQIDTRMRMQDPSSLGFVPEFQNVMGSYTGEDGRITDYLSLMKALQAIGAQRGLSARQLNAAYVNQ